jgi:hypothetical protein
VEDGEYDLNAPLVTWDDIDKQAGEIVATADKTPDPTGAQQLAQDGEYDLNAPLIAWSDVNKPASLGQTPTWETSNCTGPDETSNDKPKKPNQETLVPEKRNNAEILVESTVFGEEFSSELKTNRICLKLQESVLTAKYRLKALNALHPSNRSTVGSRIPNRIDGETVRDALEGAGVEDYVHVPEPEPAKDDDGDAGDWDNIPGGPIFPSPRHRDYTNQQAILQGVSLPRIWYHNFLGDISAEDEAEVMETCTQFQRADLANFARHVPCGLLIEKGAPGTSRTTALNKLVELQWRQGKKVGCYAPTNSAVNNSMGRALQNSKDPDRRLFTRMWSPNAEYRAISTRFSPESMEEGPQQTVASQNLGTSGKEAWVQPFASLLGWSRRITVS